MLAEIDNEYPNIQAMIDSLSDTEKQLGLMFLSMLDGDTIARIEAQMPNMINAHSSNDTAGIMAILSGFGMDESSIEMVMQTRENAINGVQD